MSENIYFNKFLLGFHLCREPMPDMAEMKRDMEILKSKGFNMVKLQENWMVDEPSEGQYDFSRYHELISYAETLDMCVYLGLTCEQAPNWLYEKYPDCRMEMMDGRKIYFQAQSTLHADGKPGPCYDHPGAMEAQLKFITKLVEELGTHQNIAVWNTWQEIAYWAESNAGGSVCYCPNTIKFYQQWLQTVYMDISNLNSHWNVRYSSFDDVLPDRCPNSVCIPQTFYFKYFMDNIQTANVLIKRCEAIKKADIYNRPVFAHKAGAELGSGMDWTYARTQDFVGTSNYPAWGSGHHWDDHKRVWRLERHDALLTEMWDALDHRMNHIRSANCENAPIWAAEYQGGPISNGFKIGRIPDSSDMHRWMLTSMSAGTTAISFWVSRAEIMAPEANGFSLLDNEGETTERLEEASKIGKALIEHSDIFSENNRQPEETAIIVNEWNYQLMRPMRFVLDAHCYDMRGWYKAMWMNSIPTRFTEIHYNKDILNRYRTLIVPMPYSLSDKDAETLIQHAKNGGNLILEGACGRLSESAFAVRGQMNSVIRDALGVQVERYAMVREPDDERWNQGEWSWGEYDESGFLEGEGVLSDVKLKANFYIETYKETDGVCLRWNGKPAGICKKIGSGQIFLIGTAVGPNTTAHIEQTSLDGISRLLKFCGVKRNHIGNLLVTKRISGTKEAWFVTNPERETVRESIQIPDNVKATDLLDIPFEITENGIIAEVDPLDVRVFIIEKISK